MKITVNVDCENAPQKEFIKAINIAFAKGDTEFLVSNVTDSIVWNIIGDKTIVGKENFKAILERMASQETTELQIDRILTHGSEGAISGTIKMENGDDYAFADFYEFSGANGDRIKSITTYVVRF